MKIRGTVAKIRFRNEENGYTVLLFSTDDGDLTCVGTFIRILEGEPYTFEGDLIFHRKYGEQFQVQKAHRETPKTKMALIRYLSGDLIPYIGEKTATHLVEQYGENVLDVLLESEEALLRVRGIGKKKAKAIRKALSEQKDSRDLVMFLQALDIGPRIAAEIIRTYGERSRAIIEENPYQLVEDVAGIGFRTADAIARRSGLPSDSLFRKKAAVVYLFAETASSSGHCYLEEEEIRDRVTGLLQMEISDLSDVLYELLLEGKLVKQKNRWYQASLYYKEKDAALRIMRLVASHIGKEDLKLDAKRIEEKMQLTLSPEQKESIQASATSPVLVITGGPGTGKTTILKAILEIFDQNGFKTALCAPTGRAAKRMEETTGREASTIHRLLGYRGESGMQPEYGEENPLEYDALVCDETSMVDIDLMANLMRAIPVHARLVFVGDADQLPSVGPGNVLGDLIASGVIATVKLDRIYRQKETSQIVANAHRINHGEMPVTNAYDSDFFFLRADDQAQIADLVEDLVKRRLPEHYGLDAKRDIQVFSVMKKGICGVENLNRLLQRALNPSCGENNEAEYKDHTFRVGDKVMQTKNNYKRAWTLRETEGEGIYNGDFGEIIAVDDEEGCLTVSFDGKETTYEGRDWEELSHAYAITVHKSQGSQFPCVILPLTQAAPMLLSRNILYTAITRAQKLLILVGSPSILRYMVMNEKRLRRNSSLDERLREYAELLQEDDDAT